MASSSDHNEQKQDEDNDSNDNSNKKAKMTSISTVLSPGCLERASSSPESFLGDLRPIAEQHSAAQLIDPLEATLPPAANHGSHETQHTEAKYLPLYVQALKVITEREPHLTLPFVKRLLVHRKLAASDAALEGLSQESQLVQHWTSILATDIPSRPSAENGEPVLNEGDPGEEAKVYLRKEHVKAVVALFLVTQAFSAGTENVCDALFARLMECDPWRMDNENNDWNCWEFSQYAFDRVKALVPLIVWEAHRQWRENSTNTSGTGGGASATPSPIQRLLEWLIFVADKSYYENRGVLVYDLYPVYQQAAETEPLVAFRMAKEWMEEKFSQDGWEWSHKTETMCFLAAKSLGQLDTAHLPDAVVDALPTMANKLMDPQTNRIKSEAEDCEEQEPLEELHQLLVNAMGLTVSEKEE